MWDYLTFWLLTSLNVRIAADQATYMGQSPAFLTSDVFILSYQVIGHFVLTIYWYHQNVRIAGDRSNSQNVRKGPDQTNFSNHVIHI